MSAVSHRGLRKPRRRRIWEHGAVVVGDGASRCTHHSQGAGHVVHDVVFHTRGRGINDPYRVCSRPDIVVNREVRISYFTINRPTKFDVRALALSRRDILHPTRIGRSHSNVVVAAATWGPVDLKILDAGQLDGLRGAGAPPIRLRTHRGVPVAGINSRLE